MEYFVIYPSLNVVRNTIIPNGPQAPVPQLKIEQTDCREDAEELKRIRQKNSPPDSVHIFEGSLVL